MFLYAAFDAMVGIGTALLLDYRQAAPPPERPIVDGVIVHLLMSSDTTYRFGLVASLAWGVGALAAAIALRDWRVSVPPVAAGGLLAWSHFPPYGAAAGLMLAIASWQFLDVVDFRTQIGAHETHRARHRNRCRPSARRRGADCREQLDASSYGFRPS